MNKILIHLKGMLSRTSGKITAGIDSIVGQKKIDRQVLDDLEELLISSDVDPITATEIVADFARQKIDKETTPLEVKKIFAEKIVNIMSPFEGALDDLMQISGPKPYVILLCGVNGNGKTTTAAKLGVFFKQKGKRVRMAACDTFRAGAIEQLKIWGDRLNIPVSYAEDRSDPAALAYDAFSVAEKSGEDVLVIDTAGRLHNRSDLMSELEKMKRVLGKQDQTAPHSVLLVLDATTGQTAISQAREFSSKIGITGIIVTKLDGTAKAGALISVVKTFKLPVIAVGLGEQPSDIQSFSAKEYAEGLLELDNI